jgi:hypothetical protein
MRVMGHTLSPQLGTLGHPPALQLGALHESTGTLTAKMTSGRERERRRRGERRGGDGEETGEEREQGEDRGKEKREGEHPSLSKLLKEEERDSSKL